MIGHTFQQWQKYESGRNEMKASKLLECAAEFKNKGKIFDLHAVIKFVSSTISRKAGNRTQLSTFVSYN